jgi:polyphosphate kinase
MATNLQIDSQFPAGGRLLKPVASLPTRLDKVLFNPELSQIEFFRRVLEQALDPDAAVLERLRFLGIFEDILDEFFMIRVAALKEEMYEGWFGPSPDGMTPVDQLQEIRQRLGPMFAEQVRCLKEDILPQLASDGIIIAPYRYLSGAERKELDSYFAQRVFPVLTPLAVDPAHPFPYISGLSLNLGLIVGSDNNSGQPRPSENSETHFVRLKIPPALPGLVQVGGGESRFVLLRELIAGNLNSLFPGMKVGESHEFRVTRDADIDIRENKVDDLLRALQQELRRRRFGAPVRLEVSATMPVTMVTYLRESLELEADDVYTIEGSLSISDLMSLCELNRPDLKYRPLRPTIPAVLKQRKSIFKIIKEHDLLLHHPYTPYSTVSDFVSAAARDPNVLAIKICLYRTGQRSRIARALIDAAERGKQVTAIVELKARFDEENNIEWAQRLETAGVHVVYGLVGLKTHCKLTQVVRREGDALECYVHIATGNYNPTTSCTYTDLGLFTADKEIAADATEFFNYLTGCSKQTNYRRLLIAPVNLREKLTGLIERETAHAWAGRPARIVAKLNRLADPAIIQALYDASQAGVSVDLIVRGVCLLRPGVAGLSENIHVRSIVGRFLEHSRIAYFANDGNEEVYVGSADWMPRNLNRRVEVVCPVNDPRLRTYLKDVVLDAYLRDNVNASELRPDGSYEHVRCAANVEEFDSQIYFEGTTA